MCVCVALNGATVFASLVWPQPAEPRAMLPVAAQREREEEEKQMTLEEYRKKQAETRKETELQRRTAGEGVDDSQWKNTVLLAKNEEEVDVCAL